MYPTNFGQPVMSCPTCTYAGGGFGAMGGGFGAMGGFGGFDPLGGFGAMGGGFGAMGGMSPISGAMDMSMLGMQQQFLSMMMGMLATLFQGGFGGGPSMGGGLPAVPAFGGGGGAAGSGGLSDFLGGPTQGGHKPKGHKGRKGKKGRKPHNSTSGRPSSPANSAGAASATGSAGKVAPWGKKLAETAKAHATGSGGLCYKYVAEDLAKYGVSVSGASAYMAADQLARSKKFREVKMSPSQLKSLPPGAVVVWNKGNGHEHGHISVALGGGKEASDMLRDQITSYGTSVRVFIPK